MQGAAAPCARATECSPVTVGIDTSRADDWGDLIFCKAFGETFVAADSALRSITVWKLASEANFVPLKLWIVGVYDSLSPYPGVPNSHDVILDGPTILAYDGDGVHPVKAEFIIDPPVILPRIHSRQYAFLIQERCVTFIDLLIDTRGDDYLDGHLWRTGRTCDTGCGLRQPSDSYPTADLVFQIEFCRPVPTAIPRSPWGRLKVRYR